MVSFPATMRNGPLEHGARATTTGWEPFAMPSDAVRSIVEMFRKSGDSQYGGEAVTQREHALQAALLARKCGLPPAEIVAALLHDVGHLLHALPDDAPEQGIDDVHEELAAAWLEKHFVSEVVEPVRLHVAAKRYLCAVESDYFAKLSPPSVLSLELQGGPMTPTEVESFRNNRHHEAAVRLRRFDEEAKVPGMPTPTVEEFVSELETCLKRTVS